MPLSQVDLVNSEALQSCISPSHSENMDQYTRHKHLCFARKNPLCDCEKRSHTDDGGCLLRRCPGPWATPEHGGATCW